MNSMFHHDRKTQMKCLHSYSNIWLLIAYYLIAWKCYADHNIITSAYGNRYYTERPFLCERTHTMLWMYGSASALVNDECHKRMWSSSWTEVENWMNDDDEKNKYITPWALYIIALFSPSQQLMRYLHTLNATFSINYTLTPFPQRPASDTLSRNGVQEKQQQQNKEWNMHINTVLSNPASSIKIFHTQQCHINNNNNNEFVLFFYLSVCCVFSFFYLVLSVFSISLMCFIFLNAAIDHLPANFSMKLGALTFWACTHNTTNEKKHICKKTRYVQFLLRQTIDDETFAEWLGKNSLWNVIKKMFFSRLQLRIVFGEGYFNKNEQNVSELLE